MVYSIEKITTLLGARRYGEKDSNIAVLLTDSRSLSFPEETLFFALKSERNDGHNYIEDLHRRGVRNFCVDNSYTIPTDKEWEDTNFLSFPLLSLLSRDLRSVTVTSLIFLSWVSQEVMVRQW